MVATFQEGNVAHVSAILWPNLQRNNVMHECNVSSSSGSHLKTYHLMAPGADDPQDKNNGSLSVESKNTIFFSLFE